MSENFDLERHPILQNLRPGETIRAVVPTTSNHVIVTERRIAVAGAERVALDVAIDELRRIQFNIERDRPATLVIVPEHPGHEPQVVAVPPEHDASVGVALTSIGQCLHEPTTTTD